MGAAEPPKVWAGHCICNLSSTLLPRQEPVNVTVRLQWWAVAAFDLPLSQGAPVLGAGFFTMLVFSGGPGRARRPRRGRSEVRAAAVRGAVCGAAGWGARPCGFRRNLGAKTGNNENYSYARQ